MRHCLSSGVNLPSLPSLSARGEVEAEVVGFLSELQDLFVFDFESFLFDELPDLLVLEVELPDFEVEALSADLSFDLSLSFESELLREEC